MSGQLLITPADASFVELRVINGAHGQVAIENGDGRANGEFDKHYVNISGYCGSHNPWVFAAAPELLKALSDLVNSFEKHRPKEYWDAARAAIAKATQP